MSDRGEFREGGAKGEGGKPIYTNFEGERGPKKRNFLVKIFQKVPKNAFFGLFFQIFACGAENLAKTY